MIVPVKLTVANQLVVPAIHEPVLLVPETISKAFPEGIAAYSKTGILIGRLTPKACKNPRVAAAVAYTGTWARVWALFPGQALVEVDALKIPPPKK